MHRSRRFDRVVNDQAANGKDFPRGSYAYAQTRRDKESLCIEIPRRAQHSLSHARAIKLAMNRQYRTPRVATLIHQATPYRGEWVIIENADRHYIARHEVEQAHGERKVIELIPLESLSEAQAFTIYLSTHGWSRQWQM